MANQKAMSGLWSAATAVQEELSRLAGVEHDLQFLLATLMIPANRDLLMKAGPEVERLYREVDRISARNMTIVQIRKPPAPADATMCQDCGAIHAPGQNTLCSR